MKTPTLYQLTVNERQAGLIARALDAYCRIRAGQLRALEDLIDPESPQALEDVREHIRMLRRVAFPDAFDNFNRPDCREAFNLRKLLEHGLAWDRNPEGGWGVIYDGPIPGWWESDDGAAMLKFEGARAKRIRDGVNRECNLYGKLAAELGTEDVEEAVMRVRSLKAENARWAESWRRDVLEPDHVPSARLEADH